MAVNENLYDWILKTQGMTAAEWYRNNPTKPHTSNPHVNPGEAKFFPEASIKTEDKTYASVSPEIVEESITVPAASASNKDSAQDFASDYLSRFQSGFSNSDYEKLTQDLSKGGIRAFDSEEALKAMYPGATYSQYEVPRYGDIELFEYGMGSSPGNIGGSRLFNKYLDDPRQDALQADYDNRIYPAIKNLTASDYVNRSEKYNSLMAEQRQNTNAQRELAREYNTLYSGKPLKGWNENYFYAENIKLPDRETFNNLMKKNASPEVIENFTDKLIAQSKGESPFTEEQPTGPRGEDLGDVASILPPAMSQGELYREIQKRGGASQGTKEYGELRDLQKEWIQRQQLKGADASPGDSDKRSVDSRVAAAESRSDEYKRDLARQSEFDLSKEKQRTAAAAAQRYRDTADNVDPFRQSVFG